MADHLHELKKYFAAVLAVLSKLWYDVAIKTEKEGHRNVHDF